MRVLRKPDLFHRCSVPLRLWEHPWTSAVPCELFRSGGSSLFTTLLLAEFSFSLRLGALKNKLCWNRLGTPLLQQEKVSYEPRAESG